MSNGDEVEFITPDTLNVICSRTRARLLARLADMPAYGDLTLRQLNSFLDAMETEMGEIIIDLVEIRHE